MIPCSGFIEVVLSVDADAEADAEADARRISIASVTLLLLGG